MARRVRINGPTGLPGDDAYSRECCFALEPSFHRMVELAVAAGWDRTEVLMAAMMLALQSLEESSQVELQ